MSPRISLSSIACVLIVLLNIVPPEAAASSQPPSGWGAETLLFTGTGANPSVFPPQLAVSKGGSALAAWSTCDLVEGATACSSTMWISTYAPDRGWAAALLLARGDDQTPMEYSVATDDSGNAAVAHTLSWRGATRAYAHVFNASLGWSEWLLLDAGDAGNASHPRLAAAINGSFLAVWSREAPKSGAANATVAVYSALLSSVTRWPQVLRVDGLQDPGMTAVYPEVVNLGAAVLAAVWFEHRGDFRNTSGYWNVTSAQFTETMGWSPPSAISTNTTGSIDAKIEFTADGAGAAFAVWSSQEYVPGTGWAEHASAARRDPALGWHSPSSVNMPSEAAVTLDDLHLLPDGTALLTWSAYWDSNRTRNAWASLSTDALQWDSRQIGPDGSSWALAAAFANGSAMVAWTLPALAPGQTIYGAWRTPAGAWENASALIPASQGVGAWLTGFGSDGAGRLVAAYWRYAVYGGVAAASWEMPDVVPPILTLDAPTEGAVVGSAAIRVTGLTEPFATVVVNGVRAPVAANGSFSVVVPLLPGTNSLTTTATDTAGNARSLTVDVTYDDPLPALQASLISASAEIAALRTELNATRASGNATSETLNATMERLASAEAALDSTAAELAAARASLDEASARLNGTAAETASEKAAIASLQSQLGNATAALAATRADLAVQISQAAEQRVATDAAAASAARAEAEAASARAAAEASTAFMALLFALALAVTTTLQLALYARLKRRIEWDRDR